MPAKTFNPGVYRGCRALVTGASGFIGRWVARALSVAGARLWLVTRNAPPADCEAYGICGEWLAADLSEPGVFARLYRQVEPDVVFNLAGYGVDPAERDEGLADALNARLPGEIGEAVAAGHESGWTGLRVVHVGSAAEYGPVEGSLTETSSTSPTTLYGRTKLEGTRALERVGKRTGLRAIAARLFTVYGSGEHAGRLLPSLLSTAQSSAALPLTEGEQQRDFTYVGDVAEGLLRLGALPGAEASVVNLATGTLTSVRAFAESAAELLGLPPGQLQFGALPSRPDEVRQGPVDTALLRRLLDWVPPSSVREGIQQTVNFEARLSRVKT